MLFVHALHVFFHPGSAVFFHSLGNMPVNVKGKSCGCVSQIALYGFYIVPVLKAENRECVAKIMHTSIEYKEKLAGRIKVWLSLCERCWYRAAPT